MRHPPKRQIYDSARIRRPQPPTTVQQPLVIQLAEDACNPATTCHSHKHLDLSTSKPIPVAANAKDSLPSMLANRSLSVSCLPVTSTADTRTENREPVFPFRSSMSLNSHDMAHGTTPRFCGESSTPSIVYVLPGFKTSTKTSHHFYVHRDLVYHVSI